MAIGHADPGRARHSRSRIQAVDILHNKGNVARRQPRRIALKNKLQR